MHPLILIVTSGMIMAMIALVGSVSIFLSDRTLRKILKPLISFSAGSLMGGAFFHLLPQAVTTIKNEISLWGSLMSGFVLFYGMEQFLNWHHEHLPQDLRPISILVTLADGLHNLIGGAAVGAAFILDPWVGAAAWLAAAAHEVPQELGDFAILIHSGLARSAALLVNFLSALTFPLGGVLAYLAAEEIPVNLLLPFAAGNFIYIAAADLIPEIKQNRDIKTSVINFIFFILGVTLLLVIKLASFH